MSRFADKNDFAGSSKEERDRQKGAALSPLSHQQTWEDGIIQGVYPSRHTCDVYTNRGKFLAGVAWPGDGSRSPRRGESVAVHYQLGRPLLVAIPGRGVANAQAPASSITPDAAYGGNDPLYQGVGTGRGRGSDAADMLPGDWLQSGDLGNFIAVLAGGTTVLKASDLAQIIATYANNLVRIVAKNFQLDTGAGSIACLTEGGKSTFTLRLGADEETESYPDEENFRIRCEMGHEGELVDFRVTDGKGRALYRLHISPDGRVEQEMEGEVVTNSGSKKEEIAGSDTSSVGGDKAESIAGSSTKAVQGAMTLSSGGGMQLQSAQNVALTALHDLFLSAGRATTINALGSLTDNIDALKVNAANGSVVFDIGSPSIGDAQIKRSGFQVSTLTGDIHFKSLLGSFKVDTTRPGGVKLGGPGPGIFSAVLYETFQSFMELFGLMIDTHVHPVPALGGIPTAPPLIPPWQTSRSLLPLSKSTFVKFGG